MSSTFAFPSPFRSKGKNKEVGTAVLTATPYTLKRLLTPLKSPLQKDADLSIKCDSKWRSQGNSVSPATPTGQVLLAQSLAPVQTSNQSIHETQRIEPEGVSVPDKALAAGMVSLLHIQLPL